MTIWSIEKRGRCRSLNVELRLLAYERADFIAEFTRAFKSLGAEFRKGSRNSIEIGLAPFPDLIG